MDHKYLSYEGLKRFFYTKILKQINLKIDKTNGDISNTKIRSVEVSSVKFPVPSSGEATKVFLGKILAFLKNIKPLESNITYYVATTGSDTTGDGSSSKPFKTIQYAIDYIPKNLSGYTAYIVIADGTYDENLDIKGFHSGTLDIKSQNSPDTLNTVCRVRKVTISNCPARVQTYGLYLTQKDDIAFGVTSCPMVYIRCCQAIESAPASIAFSFTYSQARMSGCKSANHINCVKAFYSEVGSSGWDDSSAVEYGILSDSSSRIAKSGNQPSGDKGAEQVMNGGMIINKYGAQIGTLQYNVNLYVSPTGSDTINSGNSSASPFKTIKWALSTIPKDLGGCIATIYLADGTYDEEVRLAGYHSGIIDIKSSSSPEVLNTVCRVRRIYANDCSARLRFYGLYMTQKADDAFYIANCSFVLVVSCQAVEDTAPLACGFNFTYSTARLYGCKCMYHRYCCRSYLSDVSSEEWISSSATDYGLLAERGGKIAKTGSQPSGDIRNESTSNGGQILEPNGTQIGNITYSGLSCTWGTVQGGYVRHGSVNAAMITVQIRVPVTVTLTANQQYVISGFPKSSVDFGIACNMPQKVTNCFFSSAPGEIRFTPTVTFAINDVIAFNCTYLTTS